MGIRASNMEGVAQLSDRLRSDAIEVMRRRINQARAALGDDPLPEEEMEAEACTPNSACDCVLGHHLNVDANRISVKFGSESEARRVAAAWGTQIGLQPGAVGMAAGWYTQHVVLPPDLQVATAAFDAGQIPDLMEERETPLDRDDIGEPVQGAKLSAALKLSPVWDGE